MRESSDRSLVPYYSRRAPEYDRIYERPERQADLAGLRANVADWLRDRRVLEVACGTGWWTEVIAPGARSVLATDASAEVLDVARGKLAGVAGVTFRTADASELAAVPGEFDAVLAAFWLSHVDRRGVDDWLAALHARVGAGARVVLLDNRFAEGSSTPVARRDGAGNTYQVRRLEDGSEHEVLKNFFEEPELRGRLEVAGDLHVRISDYYWAVRYTVAG